MNNPTMLDDPENLSDKAVSAWENATEQEIAKEAGQAWSHTKEKAGEVLHSGERYLRDHPGTSMLGVFGAGVLVGALAAWSLAHEQRDDASDIIHRFFSRLGRKLNLD
ncbi:hypothetical protein [Prosthecobacter sp.]|uniref:hypothetical protein n=1 Tax=Prosthecobacter sp. TaxID=1965333 RepID=UPI002489E3ED|nr:hypothetical protein [Prosthecobacter sp.]MDI1312288.1 hypothetical protein [Prosthecobacter sp.]